MNSDEVRHHKFVTEADEMYKSKQWEVYLALLSTTQPYKLTVDQLAKQAAVKLTLKQTLDAVSHHLAKRHARHRFILCTMQQS